MVRRLGFVLLVLADSLAFRKLKVISGQLMEQEKMILKKVQLGIGQRVFHLDILSFLVFKEKTGILDTLSIFRVLK